LNWAVRGYQAWRAREGGKLEAPPQVTEAVEAYKHEMDIFGQWVEECCELGANAMVPAGYAYQCFKSWAGFNGYKPWTNARFGRKVKERFLAKRTSACWVYE